MKVRTYIEWRKQVMEPHYPDQEQFFELVWNAARTATLEEIVAKTPEPKPVGISGAQHHHLMQLIVNYTAAKIDESWKGGGDPADVPDIDEAVRETNRKLVAYLTLLRAPV